MIQPTFINLHPNKYNQEFYLYPFAVKLDECAGSCNTLNAETKQCDKAKSNDKETRSIPTNFNEKNITCKIQNVYILLDFLLITIALLTAVSIYCYLIKYGAKQKHLLPFHDTNNKLKQV